MPLPVRYPSGHRTAPLRSDSGRAGFARRANPNRVIRRSIAERVRGRCSASSGRLRNGTSSTSSRRGYLAHEVARVVDRPRQVHVGGAGGGHQPDYAHDEPAVDVEHQLAAREALGDGGGAGRCPRRAAGRESAPRRRRAPDRRRDLLEPAQVGDGGADHRVAVARGVDAAAEVDHVGIVDVVPAHARGRIRRGRPDCRGRIRDGARSRAGERPGNRASSHRGASRARTARHRRRAARGASRSRRRGDRRRRARTCRRGSGARSRLSSALP